MCVLHKCKARPFRLSFTVGKVIYTGIRRVQHLPARLNNVKPAIRRTRLDKGWFGSVGSEDPLFVSVSEDCLVVKLMMMMTQKCAAERPLCARVRLTRGYRDEDSTALGSHLQN